MQVQKVKNNFLLKRRGLIGKGDFESYCIPIPLFLRRQKKQAFICKELEKVHPCFSDRCCYDMHVHLKKGKLMATVTVMDKMKLAQYRAKYSGKKLLLEEGSTKEIFVEKKDKIISCAVYGILFVSVGICGFAFCRQANESAHKNTDVKSIKMQASTIEEKELSLVQPLSICKPLFEEIRNKGGTVTQFTYTAGKPYSIQLQIHDCFPEVVQKRIPAAKNISYVISPVSYITKSPYFSITLTVTSEDGSATEKIQPEVIPTLRPLLLRSNVLIAYENSEESEISFSVQAKQFYSIAQKIKEMSDVTGASLVKIDIAQSESIIKGTFAWGSKSLIETNEIPLLYAEYQIPFATKIQRSDVCHKTKTKSQTECIGKITSAEGITFVYYYDENGKIKEVQE